MAGNGAINTGGTGRAHRGATTTSSSRSALHVHTNAGELTTHNTGLTPRAAAILDANIEAAAAAMASYQLQRYARAQREADTRARRAALRGGAAAQHRPASGEQARDRLARMIAPGGGSVTIGVGSPAAQATACDLPSTPPATPPPSAREVQERESRRHAFLRQGVATGGSVLKAARPATLGRAAAYAEPDQGNVRRRLSPISGGDSALSSPSGSPVGSPRVKPMLTTADGRQVYIDADEPMEVPSSSEDGEDGSERQEGDQSQNASAVDAEAARGLVLEEPWEVLGDTEGVGAGSSSSEMSSPGMFGEGERALYSLYMDAISRTDTIELVDGDEGSGGDVQFQDERERQEELQVQHHILASGGVSSEDRAVERTGPAEAEGYRG